LAQQVGSRRRFAQLDGPGNLPPEAMDIDPLRVHLDGVPAAPGVDPDSILTAVEGPEPGP
jgi:hypothetical protein